MSGTVRIVAAIIGLAVAASCASGPPRGGGPETQLAAATQTEDLTTVKQLLARGADPNRLVDVAGNPQSAWYLALNQLRASTPATTEIVLAMLAAGARPTSAWGTSGGRPREGFWQTFLSGGRVAGTSEENPLTLAIAHPVPAVVRAIVDAGFKPRDRTRALVEAVAGNQVEIVNLLVEHGVAVNAGSNAASSPLGAAIETRNVALMTDLEDHGATESGR